MSEQIDDQRHPTVLVVEDDETVMDVIVRIIERGNYRAFAASTGSEALELVKQMPSGPDLVVLDVLLPDMQGVDLLKLLMRVRSGYRVLFISGYSTMTLSQLVGVYEGARFLKKPFTMDALLAEIKGLLEDPPSSSPDD